MEDVISTDPINDKQIAKDEEQKRIEEIDRFSMMVDAEAELAHQQAIVDSLTEELECCET